MMRHIVFLVVILTFCKTGSFKILPRLTVNPREANSCEERKTAGVICESCDLLSICVKHSNGWVNIPVETCDNDRGFYCNSQVGACSNLTGPCHPFSFEGNFPCTSAGWFPDPFDCQKYHFCHLIGGALVSTTGECEGDKAFDAASGQCSLSLKHSVCTEKQFTCNQVGQTGSWPRNPSIFYVCKATSNAEERLLYPSLYRCADGQTFDGTDCLDVSTGSPVIPTLPWSPSATSTNPTPLQCQAIGLYADPLDCHKYYYCSSIGFLNHQVCPMGSYFNNNTGSCTLGSC